MPDAPVTVLVVDDEPLGRDLLRHLLSAHADFQLVAECADGEQALAAIQRHAPQVVFLDVRMPKLDGMKLLERLPPDERRLIVFVTAHEEYALPAFAAHALDYLLKPFDPERFDQTLARVRHWLAQRAAADVGHGLRHLLAPSPSTARAAGQPDSVSASRIVIREQGRILFVEIAEVVWVEASGNYVALHLHTGKVHLAHETMSAMEARLDPREFVRIHRSTLVRITAIRELQPHFNGEFVVLLRDGERLKLSRSYLASARTALGLE